MHTGKGQVCETYLEVGGPAARVLCPAELIPRAGEYLLAIHPESDESLPVPIFPAGAAPDGFYASPPLPVQWMPGTSISLRGPLGHGYCLPSSARRVVLVALGETPARLLGLMKTVLAREGAVVLVSEVIPPDLPPAVEIQSLRAFPELARWADFMALDLLRSQLHDLPARLNLIGSSPVPCEAQALIITAMPCGALAECGVCAVPVRRGYLLACKDGPVFPLSKILG